MAGEHVLVIDDSPTILKVVQLALTRAGYDVRTAQDGETGLALARDSKPDLVLLDFVLPGPDGLEVCKALHNDSGLADVPIVVMSAKGEEVGERFHQVPSVVDYMTKPFSPEALVGVVGHAIAKRKAVPLAAEATSDTSTGTALAAALEATIPPHSRPTPDVILTTGLDGDTGATDTAAPAGGDGATTGVNRIANVLAVGVALQGDLAVVAVSDVLSLVHDRALTGALEVRRGDALVEISLRAGRIDFARAEGLDEEFLLGRFACETGALRETDLATVLEARRKDATRLLLGADLVARGLLTAAALRQAMVRQSSALVHEVIRWPVGNFAFRALEDLGSLAQGAHLDLSVDGLLMEGFRRVDEWRLIEREIASFDLILVRDEDRVAALGRGSLTRDELAVLDLVNGKNAIKEIVRESRLGSFDVAKMLYRLLRLKLVRRRVQVRAV